MAYELTSIAIIADIRGELKQQRKRDQFVKRNLKCWSKDWGQGWWTGSTANLTSFHKDTSKWNNGLHWRPQELS